MILPLYIGIDLLWENFHYPHNNIPKDPDLSHGGGQRQYFKTRMPRQDTQFYSPFSGKNI